ncbi:MAG: hypothetical protein KDC38_10610 [Planctomycetes bacterium]|nr:hypothetical protein [Planctomycetota bacterium]
MRRTTLNAAADDDLSSRTTAEERLDMVWTLTLEAWELSGRPLPDYERSACPVRWIESRSP